MELFWYLALVSFLQYAAGIYIAKPFISITAIAKNLCNCACVCVCASEHF